VATPAASDRFHLDRFAFTLKLPSNWVTSRGKVANEQTTHPANELRGTERPALRPQPAVLIYYNWPAAGEISSDDAWQQAYALASATFKVLPMTLTTGGAITLGGESGQYIGYWTAAGQGELVG